MKEAMLYEKLPDNRVRCNLCAHRCVINEGKKGICGVRRRELRAQNDLPSVRDKEAARYVLILFCHLEEVEMRKVKNKKVKGGEK